MKDRLPFLEALQQGVLIGDGALGTELLARGAPPDVGIERLNLLAPDLVLSVHRDYLAAGSQLIETNTFGANRPRLARHGAETQVREIILAGVRLARAAAGHTAYVAGSIGPLPTVDGEPLGAAERTACMAEQVAALLEGGVDLLLFETFTQLDPLISAVAIARAMTDRPIIAQMAFDAEGRTAEGEGADQVTLRCRAAGADVVGANCGYGVPSIRSAVTRMVGHGLPVSAFLNAGFPEEVDGRLLYRAAPEYLARRAVELADCGVRLLGGCCGIGPDTIRALAQALARHRQAPVIVQMPEVPAGAAPSQGAPTLPLDAPFPVLVELDPPPSLDTAPLLAAARTLRAAGATALTVADNPMASVRLDTLTAAAMLQRESGLPIIPHFTGRDRNRIALQSTIMGAQALGMSAVLCVTGDPIRLYQEPNTSGVFDVTSVGLVNLVAEFNAGQRLGTTAQTALTIGVAVNPNVRTPSGQIDKLRRKIDAGAQFALTQPIFEEERWAQFQELLADAGITIPVYPGILPLTSARNADFLHNEVPGMRIPEAIRERLAGLATVADQRAAGQEIALELIGRLAPHAPGLYLITPRNRAELVTPLIAAAKAAMPV